MRSPQSFFKIFKHTLKLVLFSAVIFSFHQPAYAQFTPLEWQSEEAPPWNRDQNRNRIDDLIEQRNPGDKIDIVVDLKECRPQDELIQKFGVFGDSVLVGRYVTFVALTNVLVADVLNVIARQFPEVAMIEYAAGFTTLNDHSVREVRVRASATYSPNTVEDMFPGLNGSGVNIAIMDSGVDDDIHESFTGRFVAGYDAITNTVTNPDDDLGHGTHVAGTALGTGGPSGTFRGVAPGAGLVDIRVFDASTFCSTPGMWARVTMGLEWAINNRDLYNIQVINMSFGQCDAFGVVYSNGLDAFSQLVNYAVAKGIVVVAAAGNSGPTVGFPAPAAATGTITVAASEGNSTDTRTDAVIADFSSVGPRADDFDGSPLDEQKPEITAPGAHDFTFASGCITGITSARHNTTSSYIACPYVGTSMAAPHVAGIAALIKQANPTMNAASVKNLLILTAEDKGAAGWDVNWGWGLVDAFAALSTPQNADVGFPNPPFRYDPVDVYLASEPPVGGVPNTIYAVIRNFGPGNAFGVRVEFGVHEFAAGINGFYDIGTQIVDIPAMTTLTVSHPWTPLAVSGGGVRHGCLKVEIGYGLDTDFSDNFAQQNVDIFEFSPLLFTAGENSGQRAAAGFKFQVENTLEQTAAVHLEVNTAGLPQGWEFSIDSLAFVLEPYRCEKEIDLQIFPGANPKPGEVGTIEVRAIAATLFGSQELGGFVARAVIPGGEVRVNKSPGWNLVSLPVQPFGSVQVDSLFGDARAAFSFSSQQGYTSVEAFQPSIGYWLNLQRGGTYPLAGIPIKDYQLDLPQGWSLIGGLYDQAGIPRTKPDGVIRAIFRYDSQTGYSVTEQILPGEAVWVYCAKPCSLWLAQADGLVGATLEAPWQTTITATGQTVEGASDVSSVVIAGSSAGSSALPAPPPVPQFTANLQLWALNFTAGPFARDARMTNTTKSQWVLEVDPHGNVPPPTNRSTTVSWDGATLGTEEPGTTWVLTEGFDGAGSVRISDMRTTTSFVVTGNSPQYFTITYEPLITRVDEKSDVAALPERFALYQNYPNPFNPVTEIRYDLPKASQVTLSIYSITGQLVRTLVDGKAPAGAHAVQWNGVDDHGHRVAGGVYFYRLTAGEFVETRKMIFLP